MTSVPELASPPVLGHAAPGPVTVIAQCNCRPVVRTSRPVWRSQARRDDVLRRCITWIVRTDQSPQWTRTWQLQAGTPSCLNTGRTQSLKGEILHGDTHPAVRRPTLLPHSHWHPEAVCVSESESSCIISDRHAGGGRAPNRKSLRLRRPPPRSTQAGLDPRADAATVRGSSLSGQSRNRTSVRRKRTP